MKRVAKYNIIKGGATLLTVGAPLATLFATSKDYIYTPEGAMSFTGILTIFLCVLLLKDKIAENWKAPSAFVVSTALFFTIIVIEHLLEPVKFVCLATMISSGVDELVLKSIYQRIESTLPEISKYYKHFGFLFTTTNNLTKEVKDE